MIRNKALSVLLTLILTMMQINVFAETDEIKPEVSELLTSMGVLNSGIDYSAPITRGEFAELSMALLYGKTGYIYDDNVAFVDVNKRHKNYGSISTMASLGYAKGYANRMFCPNDSITVEDASTIIVKILGYEWRLDIDGSYENVARSKDIFDNVTLKNKENLTYSAAATMIFNTLYADISDYNTIDGNVKTKGRDIYMSRRLNIHYIDGVVYDNGITAFWGQSGVSNEYVVIGDKTLLNESGKEDLLGYRVRGYYIEDDNKSEDVLFCACILERKNSMLTIGADELTNYENNIYTYYPDESTKGKKAKLSKDFTVIYNGYTLAGAAEYNEHLMMPKIGGVRLIDNDSDGSYDIVFVTFLKDMYVVSADIEQEKLYCKDDNPIDLKEYDEYTVKNAVGKEIPLESASKAVVSIAESIDKKYCSLYVSIEKKEGTVKKIEEDEITIDESLFKLSPDFKQDISLNDIGVFYLSLDNKIVYFEDNTKDGIKYGIVLRVNYCDEDDENVGVRIYNEDNQSEIIRCAKRVKIDGRNYKDMEQIKNLIEENTQEIISYKTNNEGLLNWVDTLNVDNDIDDSLYVVEGYDGVKMQMYNWNMQSFGQNCVVTSKTKVFIVPADFDENKIAVTDLAGAGLLNDNKYAVKAYKQNRRSVIPDVIIIYKNPGLNIHDNHILVFHRIVKSVEYTLNKDDEPCCKLTLYNKNGGLDTVYTTSYKSIEFERDGKNYELEPGDIVRLGYDKDGKADENNLIVFYDASEDYTSFDYLTEHNYISALNIRWGWIYSKEGDYIQVAYDTPGKNMDPSKLMSYNTKKMKIYVCESGRGNKKTVELGNINDLLSYNDVGGACTKAVVYCRTGQDGFIVLYK